MSDLEIPVPPLLRRIVFDYPHRFIFGPGSIQMLSEEVSRLTRKNEANIFLVSDRNLVKVGLVDKVVKIIEEKGYSIQIFDEVVREPDIDTADMVSVEVRKDKYDLIIGLGGGSSLDMAKVASVASTNPGSISEYINYMEDRIKFDPLPKILIPTTAGSGSEVSSYAVVIGKQGFKEFISSFKLVADTALVDPLLTLSCPPKQTAWSGLDVLSTAVEAFLSKASSFFSDAYSLYTIQLVAKYLRISYHQPENLEARTAMSLAASLSGIAASTPAGVNIGHCIAETIGPRFNIPHGLACGIILPYMVKFNMPACPDRVATIAQYFNQDLPLNIYERARSLVRELKQLLLDLDIPLTLNDVGVAKDELKSVAELIVRDRQYKYGLPVINPRIITMDNVEQLLEDIWSGNI